ncbi:hypothetical protein GW17_00041652 [Ensete ventricosum]|nr:hypothetical protein GW17_00041652 [Ensete ventricosum]
MTLQENKATPYSCTGRRGNASFSRWKTRRCLVLRRETRCRLVPAGRLQFRRYRPGVGGLRIGIPSHRYFEPRFAISTCTAWYGRYIPVRQVAGTWTVRYWMVLPKIDRRWSILVIGDRLKGEIDRQRSIEGEIDHRRLIEREKGKKKRKSRKKEKKRGRIPSARAPLPPARRRGPAVLFLSRGEKDRGDYLATVVFGAAVVVAVFAVSLLLSSSPSLSLSLGLASHRCRIWCCCRCHCLRRLAVAVFAAVAVAWITSLTPGFLFVVVRCSSPPSLLPLVAVAATPLAVSGKARTARYIPVRQLTGTRTGRYRAVPLKLVVGGRFRPSVVDFGRWWSIKGEIDRWRSIKVEKGKRKKKKKKKRKIRKKKKRRRRNTSPACPRRPRVACQPSPPAGDFSPRAGREIEATSPLYLIF